MSAAVQHYTGTVLRGVSVIIRNQVVSFVMGQAIDVDGEMHAALRASDACFIAWDGELPPHSSTLPSDIWGKPVG